MDEIGILSVDHNNINLDDGNFDEDDPKTIVYVRCIARRKRVKQRKAFKNDISKELMPAAWHTT